MSIETNQHEFVVLYDGVCALCNQAIKFLLKIDRRKILKYTPLEGETAKSLLPNFSEIADAGKSVIFVRRIKSGNLEFYYRSDAILRILAEIGGFWKALIWLKFIPRIIRDFVYNLIANNRYRWFGKYDACPLPSPEWRDRFLP